MTVKLLTSQCGGYPVPCRFFPPTFQPACRISPKGNISGLIVMQIEYKPNQLISTGLANGLEDFCLFRIAELLPGCLATRPTQILGIYSPLFKHFYLTDVLLQCTHTTRLLAAVFCPSFGMVNSRQHPWEVLKATYIQALCTCIYSLPTRCLLFPTQYDVSPLLPLGKFVYTRGALLESVACRCCQVTPVVHHCGAGGTIEGAVHLGQQFVVVHPLPRHCWRVQSCNLEVLVNAAAPDRCRKQRRGEADPPIPCWVAVFLWWGREVWRQHRNGDGSAAPLNAMAETREA
ncbi:hypothetical protein DFH08DRAFT_815212 [Mycena albidolilacea]|uniref:Uncharacterized protein n=1 Tax=Mycena albidolilacea TaxID=1033008 RepID=A0AAD6ZMK8_9AGAR|nr:hypothetical protein DFH08DRAFT_815212 [Mycena albidolilacea]